MNRRVAHDLAAAVAIVATLTASLAAAAPQAVVAPPAPAAVANLARTVAVNGNPGSTASTTMVMAGFGRTITPARTGNVWVQFAAYCYNTTAADQVQLQLAYGTGTAPANGAAATGTTFGPLILSQSTSANASQNCSLGYELTGLTVGVAYWIDPQFKAGIGGTANIPASALTLQEVPQ
ncbi:MAG TPA: hypothetical protein VFC47_03955 [Caulobacteraceae bacterium]|nr:hypothetical protein [Caulobacteraceae bacterium]